MGKGFLRSAGAPVLIFPAVGGGEPESWARGSRRNLIYRTLTQWDKAP